MKKIKWIIDKGLFPEYEDKLIKSIENSGNIPILIDYENNINILKNKIKKDINDDDIVIFHGSIQFEKRFNNFPFYPLSYITYSNYDCYNYYGYLGDELLNSKYLLMGLNDVIRNKSNIINYFNLSNNDKIFIRPSNGFKTFTGQLLPINNFDKEFDILTKSYGGIYMSTLVLISNFKDIKNEYRFIIIDNKIITGSLYIDENNKNTYKPYYNKPIDNKIIFNYVDMIKNLYQPDEAYTIDIAELYDGTLKVLELNSFNCASFYGCDYDKIVNATNKLVLKDYYEIFS